DLVTQASVYPFHLQLSGHSHGGQIQLPWIGPLVTPPLAKQYVEGFYDVQQLTLYVNRGLGTTRMPFRFLTPPELTLFTLKAGL
ncbi:MAG: metallophosphoesterase, partial [Anoxybacillus gonensis]|nr:metallophosphoesterase [Anoxybacillus gonensis]